ncbi:uncharacterized protein LOC114259511 [Camellia sinensis]|uniref:Transmembrane protein n=1 Tax=Camellia sinensis var. sinensis TaxID=542762 RepID=A0A4S4EW71_CAMSN|nr:uncharacterized protein LOC114259511 [Camellia sinensis]THG20775.1 hypothetical protein TEA_003849 [Camellia sinensis var. sinensis]
MLQSQHLLSSNFFPPLPLSHSLNPSLCPHSSPSPFNFSYRPTTLHSLSAHLRSRPETWLAELPEPTTITTAEDGPIELPPSTPSIFATSDDPSSLQVATSLLLTGAISVFLFRSLRRRARRAKELKFRSSGAKKSLKEEAIESLKAMAPGQGGVKDRPSPIQALLGGVSAGVIALILYKFTTTIESSLNRQTLSDNFSVRQITITIRTIINGLCYLATFVFGLNSIGLVLYSGQLAINSFMGDSSSERTENEDEAQISSDMTVKNPTDSSETSVSNGDQSSDKQ